MRGNPGQRSRGDRRSKEARWCERRVSGAAWRTNFAVAVDVVFCLTF